MIVAQSRRSFVAELLLLDEPSEGMTPLVVNLPRRNVVELKPTDLSIVLAERNRRS